MKAALVTGVSRGIGEAVAQALLLAGWHVYGFSRGRCPLEHENFVHIPVDLRDPLAAEKAVRTAVASLKAAGGLVRAALVNNAAVLGPVGDFSLSGAGAVSAALTLNTAVPLWSGHFLLREFRSIPCVVVNLSSGAAVSPYAGWSIYCASKAALRMGSLALKEELPQLERAAPAAVVIYAPGVVDTSMQKEVRESDSRDLPMVGKFIDLHKNGRLLDPALPAGEIAAYCGMELRTDTLIDARYPAGVPG